MTYLPGAVIVAFSPMVNALVLNVFCGSVLGSLAMILNVILISLEVSVGPEALVFRLYRRYWPAVGVMVSEVQVESLV